MGEVKESLHTILTFPPAPDVLNYEQSSKEIFFVTLGVLMNMILVLRLGLKHSIVCLHLKVLSEAAYLGRSESLSFYGG